MAKDDFKVKKGLVVGKGIVADSAVTASAFVGDGSQITGLNYNNISTNLPNILDSGNVNVLIAAADTHDSAAIQAQIDSSISNNIVGTANEVEVTASGGVATIGLPNEVQITTSLTVGGNNVLTTASDTHDSDAVVAQINSAFSSKSTSDLSEGTNLYYTTARVDSDISSKVDSDYIELRRPAETIFDVVNNGFAAYNFGGDGFVSGTNNPTLYLTRGKTYKFEVNASGHPFYIKTNNVTGTGSQYTDGVTNNGVQVGNLFFTVPMNAPTTLYYICQYHSSMVGIIYIDKDVGLDSASVNSLISAADTHDSSAVQGQITNTVNLAYINSFSGGDFDSALLPKLAASDITSGIFDSARIPQLSTNDVNEGTNRYYTTSRTRSDIGLGTNTVKFGNGLSYSSGLGRFSFDGPDSSDIRKVFSGGTGVSIDGTGSISVGQSVGTTDDVTFADITASNLTVTGTTTSIDTVVYTTNDPLIHLADSNEQSDVVDIGFLGHYYRDGQRRHTGLFRDASNQQYYLYHNMKDSAFDSSIPPNVINRSATDFTLSTLNVGTLIGQYQGFDTDFNAKSTSDLSEGTNLYYTIARNDSDTKALVDSDYVRLRADSDYIKTVTGFPSANLNNSSVTVTAGNGLLNGGSVSLGGSVTISIDSANIQSFTLDSAEVINLIDSDYVRPLARAAIVAGANITYDSATGVIAGVAAYGDADVTDLVNSDYVKDRADSDYIKTVTGIPITNLAASTFEVVAGKGLLNGGSASLGGTVTINIDSANIQGFTVDSAEVINLIDSDYVRPLARAAIVAGANITYDSATGVIASTGAGATLAFSVSLYLLDSTSRAGTGITSPLGVGDPVFYDSDAGYWTGAKADSDLVASHVITNFSTSTATFEIAQTGIFNLDSNGSSPTFIKNSFYYLSDSAGVPTPTQPLTGVFQPLYYALDSNKIDINISDAVSIGLGTTDVEQFPAVTPGDSDLTLTQTINTDRTDVFKNGILLRQGVDYTIVSPSLIKATTAPQLGDIFSVRSTVTGATLNDTITGITAAAPSPAVAGDNNTGLFSSAADTVSITTGGSERLRATNSGVEVTGTLTTNAINGGPTIDSATISGDLTLTGGVGIPNNVSLSDAATINFNIDSGNTGTLTFGSSGNRTLVVGVTGGASMAPYIGTSFTILAFNNDASNDRTLTVQAAAGDTLHFGSSNVITVKSQKMSIISGMVFDADELVLSSVTLDSSVTF